MKNRPAIRHYEDMDYVHYCRWGTMIVPDLGRHYGINKGGIVL